MMAETMSKPAFNRYPSLIYLMGNLLNPPPLASMTALEKVGRSLSFSLVLCTGAVVAALLLTVGLYLMEH